MTYYAVLDGVRVLGVVEQDVAPVGVASVALPSFAGWPAGDVGEVQVQAGVLVRVDTRTLAEAKAAKWEHIKAEREQRAAQAGHAVTPALDSSEADRANITSVAVMLMAAPAIPSVRFTCADNERRTIARADFLAAALTIGGAVQALFEVADNLRAEIEAAATVAEVDAIEWP